MNELTKRLIDKSSSNPASEATVAELEEKFGSLPKDLREFYRNTNGVDRFASQEALDLYYVGASLCDIETILEFGPFTFDEIGSAFVIGTSGRGGEFLFAPNGTKQRYFYARDCYSTAFEDFCPLGDSLECFLKNIVEADSALRDAREPQYWRSVDKEFSASKSDEPLEVHQLPSGIGVKTLWVKPNDELILAHNMGIYVAQLFDPSEPTRVDLSTSFPLRFAPNAVGSQLVIDRGDKLLLVESEDGAMTEYPLPSGSAPVLIASGSQFACHHIFACFLAAESKMVVIDLNGNSTEFDICNQGFAPLAIAFSSDGRQAAIRYATDPGFECIHLVDLPSGDVQQELKCQRSVGCVLLQFGDGDQKLLAVQGRELTGLCCSSGNQLFSWQIPSPLALAAFIGSFGILAVSGVAARVIDIRTHECLFRYSAGTTTTAAFHRNGTNHFFTHYSSTREIRKWIIPQSVLEACE